VGSRAFQQPIEGQESVSQERTEQRMTARKLPRSGLVQLPINWRCQKTPPFLSKHFGYRGNLLPRNLCQSSDLAEGNRAARIAMVAAALAKATKHSCSGVLLGGI
jgi:hypothetical protein